ncbi:MAG TPA: hypothetical protein VM537_36130, partial [Anaerolineae bacterium]|nr:hypothetical protein [Anaerolineae bacterium]
EIEQADPGLTIIHSTVAVGTTAKLRSMLPRRPIVHSPVRGPHPHLEKALRTFVKFIGADDEGAGQAAEEHLRSLGLKVRWFSPAATTELGKLLDTTYYGLCIAWHGEMERMCQRAGVCFDDAVTCWNETYNEGYKQLGWDHVVRPVLRPPAARIGGHCVIPNAGLLHEYTPGLATELVLQYTDHGTEQGLKSGD